MVLVADKDMEHALRGIFSRPQALGIRSIEADIYIHPQHDPACALRGVEFLSSFSEQYSYSLLMFDHEGSGRENTPPQELQDYINKEFVRSPWCGRGRAIVVSPELEVWVWSDSPHVADVVGWNNRKLPLRCWLTEQGWLKAGEFKPRRPKEAFQAALYEAGKPRSASLYRQLAERVSLAHCSDMSFREFRNVLREWFPKG